MSELLDVRLGDKYELDEGRVFMTGIQALVRLPIMQRRLDQQGGLNTAGYISGYRGSPLGMYDQQLRSAKALLDAHHIVHQPGVNEDLAITACSGTQQAALIGESHYDGVFAIWYAKGPGVDRSGDALRHANLFGTARHGGVLCLLGDDHTCESSTTAHQSDYAMVDAMIPVLNPAGVDEILRFGLFGIAMSRYSGALVSLKCVHETVESTASIEIGDTQPKIMLPENHDLPPDGLNIRWPDHGLGQTSALAQERRVHEGKLEAAKAFARANDLDRIVLDCDHPRLVVITAGKSHFDLIAALEDLGIDQARAALHGLRVYKVGMTYPLEPSGLVRAIAGSAKVMVIEEKRGLIESQAKEILYGSQNAPQIIGKRDEFDQALFQSYSDLNANQVAVALAARLLDGSNDPVLAARLRAVEAHIAADSAQPSLVRTPYFCAGCPHNSSTVVPEGSKALAGIGCHFLVQFMNRDTDGFTQMGGEGASWIGAAPFTDRRHVFQNIGDGTYYHSGSLAIRAAIAAGTTNITFKILYNDAVAMTGGQKMELGNLTVPDIARNVQAEGVAETVIVTDEPGKYPLGAGIPSNVRIYHRRELDAVQRRLRLIEGVTVLIYDQTCAAEKRRRRKRGTFPDPGKRVLINQRVCEGCGDCGVQSNCVAIQPVETAYGRKRKIDQSACNKDFSCTHGFCPSFVTVHGGKLKKGASRFEHVPFEVLPEPTTEIKALYNIVVTGIGGTGVVTIAALIGMAAHLEQKEFAAIDMIGLAQKGGSVISHLKLAPNGQKIGAPRVAASQADLVIGCDIVVTAGKSCLAAMQQGRTRTIVNLQETMTGAFTQDPDMVFPTSELLTNIEAAVGTDALTTLDAASLASNLLGDAIGANLISVGFAYQKGLLPVSAAAIERAIEINGVAVDMNKAAFLWGRRTAHDAKTVQSLIRRDAARPMTIEERAEQLTQYQNSEYAERYVAKLSKIQGLGSNELTQAVAENLFKLMAIKDEYEVARLYTDGIFIQQVTSEFERWDKLEFHLAPPLLAGTDPRSGQPIKQSFGPWMMRVFRFLASIRHLRGRWCDPFGYTAERKMERRLLKDYQALLDEIAVHLHPANEALAIQLATLPGKIRGFGHVKAASVRKAKTEEQKLLAQFRESPSRAHAAE